MTARLLNKSVSQRRSLRSCPTLSDAPDLTPSFPAALPPPTSPTPSVPQVIPVPTYYPDVTTILGRPVYRTVAAAAAAASSPGEQQQPLDCVDVFRRPADVPGHVADVIAARPRVVWLQSGIRCPEAEVGGWLGDACKALCAETHRF